MYRRTSLVAHQWHQNGDHPADGPADREGKVVRYYRTPDNAWYVPCPVCGNSLRSHGWIDEGDGHTVCPGNWIVTTPDGKHLPCPEALYKHIKDIT